MQCLPVALSWLVAPQAFAWRSKLMWHAGRPAVTYAGKVTVDHFGEVPACLQLAAILRAA
jgi:hypothetical protein